MLGPLRAGADQHASVHAGLRRRRPVRRATTEAGVPGGRAPARRAATVPADIEQSAFRVIQEATTNVVRHAARQCRGRRIPGAELTIEVRDDGPARHGAGTAGPASIGHARAGRPARGRFQRRATAGGRFRVRAGLPR